jgi:hypothetical protein
MEEVKGKEEQKQDAASVGLTGKEVEDFMIKAAQDRAEDPTEMAATAYTMYGPYLRMALPKLSKRSLMRVINYLVFYPFAQKDPNAKNEAEKSVMQLANLLAESKFIMTMSQYAGNLEDVVKAVEAELTEEQVKEFEQIELGTESSDKTEE